MARKPSGKVQPGGNSIKSSQDQNDKALKKQNSERDKETRDAKDSKSQQLNFYQPSESSSEILKG